MSPAAGLVLMALAWGFAAFVVIRSFRTPPKDRR